MHELNKQNSLATLETIEEVISAFKSIDDLLRAPGVRGPFKGIMAGHSVPSPPDKKLKRKKKRGEGLRTSKRKTPIGPQQEQIEHLEFLTFLLCVLVGTLTVTVLLLSVRFNSYASFCY
ncbi:MAG: hypothetical protein ACLVHV_16020 [Oscillospiraceae bacterium]